MKCIYIFRINMNFLLRYEIFKKVGTLATSNLLFWFLNHIIRLWKCKALSRVLLDSKLKCKRKIRFIVACTRLYKTLCRSVVGHLVYIYFWSCILLFRSLQRLNTAPAQPHATEIAVYTALFVPLIECEYYWYGNGYANNKADRHKSRAPSNQRPTDGRTDQPTNQPTDKTAYRVACIWLIWPYTRLSQSRAVGQGQ